MESGLDKLEVKNGTEQISVGPLQAPGTTISAEKKAKIEEGSENLND